MSTWTYEQSAHGTTEPLAFPNNVKAGSLLIVCETANPAATDPAVPTDTRGTTYTRIRRIVDSGNAQMGVWWWGIAPSAGANTVDFTTGNAFRGYLIMEVSVDAGTIAIDDASGTPVEIGQLMTSNTTAANNLTSTSATTQGADRLIVGFLSGNNSNGVITAGSSFTIRETGGVEGFPNVPQVLETRTLAAAGSVAATFTSTTNLGGAGVFMAAFKAVSSGAFEIDAQPGSYAVTGSAATVVAARMIDASPGSYAVTGDQAQLAAALILSVDPGTYVVTGVAAELAALAALELDANPGSYTVTGADAGLAAGYAVDAEGGSYATAGSDAALAAALIMAANPGSYLVSGHAATLSANVPDIPGLVFGGDRASPDLVAGGDRTDAYASGGDRRSG